MKNPIILIITIVLLSFLCKAQSSLSYNNINVSELNEAKVFDKIITLKAVTIGSQFLFPSWQPGSILFTTGTSAQNVNIKYNGYSDELFWLSPSLSTVIVQKEAVKKFTMICPETDSIVEFIRKDVPVPFYSQQKLTYLQVLYQGNVNLYVYRQILKTGEEIKQDKNRAVELPVVEPKPIYYIEKGDGNIVQLKKIKRSTILKAFPAKKEIIKKSLTEKKLKIKNENDLIRVFYIIDKLVEN
jgi:hypothetical protein